MQTGKTKRISAPIRGWNTDLSDLGMHEDYALQLDNWIPRKDGCALRGGQAAHVTGFAVTVESLLPYHSPAASALFAATSGGIYAATSTGAVGAALLALTNGALQHTQITTSAGSFLVAVNGVDKLSLYSGSAWAAIDDTTTPAITGLATTSLVHVSTHAKRLFFCANTSSTVYYLDVDSVGGALGTLALGSYFPRGGYVMATASWTRDGGSGMDDFFVAISSEGEVVVFTGTDPSDATTWLLAGSFYIGKPLGRRCFAKVGGELYILTRRGVVALSDVVKVGEQGDLRAASRPIGPTFKTYVDAGASWNGWELLHVPEQGLLICNVPVGAAKWHQLVMVTDSGAWTRFIDIESRCLGVLNGVLYSGMGTQVAKLFTVGSDFGVDIVARVRQANTYLGSSSNKRVNYVRPIFSATTQVRIGAELSTDADYSELSATLSAGLAATNIWDTAVWDTAQWGGTTLTSEWLHTPSQPGRCFSLQFQLGYKEDLLLWKATDYLYTPAGLM